MESIQPCSSDNKNNNNTATFCQDEDTTSGVNGTSEEDLVTLYGTDGGRGDSGGDWPTVRRELQWALPVHVYGFACLFFMLAFYTFFSILNLRSQLSNRPFMSTINVFLCLLGVSRAACFLIDPYTSGQVMPGFLGWVLWDVGYPCLLSAFSLIQLAFSQLTQVKFRPETLRRKSALSLAITTHFALVLGSDLVTAFQSHLQIVRWVVQTVFLSWGLVLCLTFLYGGARILRLLRAIPHSAFQSTPTNSTNTKGILQLALLAQCNNIASSVITAAAPSLLTPKIRITDEHDQTYSYLCSQDSAPVSRRASSRGSFASECAVLTSGSRMGECEQSDIAEEEGGGTHSPPTSTPGATKESDGDREGGGGGGRERVREDRGARSSERGVRGGDRGKESGGPGGGGGGWNAEEGRRGSKTAGGSKFRMEEGIAEAMTSKERRASFEKSREITEKIGDIIIKVEDVGSTIDLRQEGREEDSCDGLEEIQFIDNGTEVCTGKGDDMCVVTGVDASTGSEVCSVEKNDLVSTVKGDEVCTVRTETETVPDKNGSASGRIIPKVPSVKSLDSVLRTDSHGDAKAKSSVLRKSSFSGHPSTPETDIKPVIKVEDVDKNNRLGAEIDGTPKRKKSLTWYKDTQSPGESPHSDRDQRDVRTPDTDDTERSTPVNRDYHRRASTSSKRSTRSIEKQKLRHTKSYELGEMSRRKSSCASIASRKSSEHYSTAPIYQKDHKLTPSASSPSSVRRSSRKSLKDETVEALLARQAGERADVTLSSILNHIAYVNQTASSHKLPSSFKDSRKAQVQQVLLVTYITAALGTLLSLALVYGLYGNFTSIAFLRRPSWLWFTYESGCRFLEFLMGCAMANITRQPVNRHLQYPYSMRIKQRNSIYM